MVLLLSEIASAGRNSIRVKRRPHMPASRREQLQRMTPAPAILLRCPYAQVPEWSDPVSGTYDPSGGCGSATVTTVHGYMPLARTARCSELRSLRRHHGHASAEQPVRL